MSLSENLIHPSDDELKELQKFDYKEVMRGIKVEKEHTDNERVAARIALDHLKENPHYYRDLAKSKIEDVMSYDFSVLLESDEDDDAPLGSWGAKPQYKEPPKAVPAKPAAPAKADVKSSEPTRARGERAKVPPDWKGSKRAFYSQLDVTRRKEAARQDYVPADPSSPRKQRRPGDTVFGHVTRNATFSTRSAGRTPDNAIASTDTEKIAVDQDGAIAHLMAKFVHGVQKRDRKSARIARRDAANAAADASEEITMSNNKVSEEVKAALNEFLGFGGGAKSSGTYTSRDKGVGSYSWHANAPKNQKVASRNAPSTPGGASGRTGIFGRLRAKLAGYKQKKADFASASANAAASNDAAIGKAFGKSPIANAEPALARKAGFTDKLTPSALRANTRSTAWQGPSKPATPSDSSVAQDRVQKATDSAMDAAKAAGGKNRNMPKAAPSGGTGVTDSSPTPKAKATPPPPPQPTASKKATPPPPPQPGKRAPSWAFGDVNQGLHTSGEGSGGSKLDIRKGAKPASPPWDTEPPATPKLSLTGIERGLNLGVKGIGRSKSAESPKPSPAAPAESPKPKSGGMAKPDPDPPFDFDTSSSSLTGVKSRSQRVAAVRSRHAALTDTRSKIASLKATNASTPGETAANAKVAAPEPKPKKATVRKPAGPKSAGGNTGKAPRKGKKKVTESTRFFNYSIIEQDNPVDYEKPTFTRNAERDAAAKAKTPSTPPSGSTPKPGTARPGAKRVIPPRQAKARTAPNTMNNTFGDPKRDKPFSAPTPLKQRRAAGTKTASTPRQPKAPKDTSAVAAAAQQAKAQAQQVKAQTLADRQAEKASNKQARMQAAQDRDASHMKRIGIEHDIRADEISRKRTAIKAKAASQAGQIAGNTIRGVFDKVIRGAAQIKGAKATVRL